ncbi:MAG: threonine/serine dehydratase [Candidatus Latescibacterota bacterium]|jgi:threonine dehydratase
MEMPTWEDVIAARDLIRPHLPVTPLVRSESLSRLTGTELWLKCENCQPVGAFKIRGGVNLIGRLDPQERRAGVISASTGNHGQSLAWAGRLFGVRVVIYAPKVGPNPAKLKAMRELGAEVRLFGRDFDEARLEVERVAAREGYRYVHSANEPHLIAGVGTLTLELLEQLPEAEAIAVPVGGGSGACGAVLVARHWQPSLRVIGVQSEAAPAAWRAWHRRSLAVEDQARTVHEGLATRVPFSLTMQILWEGLDDFVLVSDAEIDEAIRLLAGQARQVAEGAGAAALAAVRRLKQRLAGRRVVVVLSGGNLDLTRYAGILAGG